jgi:predicted nucleotidyltransferase component of viral defense system
MKLYYNAVSGILLEALHKLMNHDAFNDFVLVGGTALSLQLGHRMSVDIDLFTAIDYGSMDLKHIKHALSISFPYTDRLETLNETNLGYTVYIGNSEAENVKLDLFYTDNFIAPVIEQDGLRLASLQDIAAMKMQAIVNSKRKKDFWDIHELLEYFTLEELIRFGLERNPYTLTEISILDSLYHSAELSQDTVITCLKGKYWELIVEDLRLIVEQTGKRKNRL